MIALRILTLSLVLTASAHGQSASMARWLGAITEDSLSQPGLFGKIINAIAGSEAGDRIAYPFGIEVRDDQYMILSRQTNNLVLVHRDSHKARILDIGKSGLIAPVATVGEPEHYYISDPEQGTVFIGRGNDLKPFVGPEQGLERPTGLAWDRDRNRLWIVDTGRHMVLCFSLDGELMLELGGRGTGDTALNYPTFIALAADGSVVVNDTMNGRIKKWDADGSFMWSSGDLLTSAEPLERAKGMAVDARDRVLVVDNMADRVMVFGPDGNLQGSFGSSGSGAGELWSPVGIAVSGDTVVVADTQNHRLALFSLAGGAKR